MVFVVLAVLVAILASTNNNLPLVQNKAFEFTGANVEVQKLDVSPIATKTIDSSEASSNGALKQLKEPSINSIKSSSDSVSSALNLENQTKILGLTSPLYEKYSFLDKAIDLSLPLFESIYQKQQSSIANLQHLQSIEYRSDVAQVVTVIQSESSRLFKVIAGIKDIQYQTKQGMEQLVNANKAIGSMPIEEYFIKFVNDETGKVDDYIYMFNPKNPDNVGSVIYARDMKTTELQEALIQSIQSTR